MNPALLAWEKALDRLTHASKANAKSSYDIAKFCAAQPHPAKSMRAGLCISVFATTQAVADTSNLQYISSKLYALLSTMRT